MVSLALGVILWGVVRITRLGLGVLYFWDSDIFAIVTLGVLEMKVRSLFVCLFVLHIQVKGSGLLCAFSPTPLSGP